MLPDAVVRTEFLSRLDADAVRRERSGADADGLDLTTGCLAAAACCGLSAAEPVDAAVLPVALRRPAAAALHHDPAAVQKERARFQSALQFRSQPEAAQRGALALEQLREC